MYAARMSLLYLAKALKDTTREWVIKHDTVLELTEAHPVTQALVVLDDAFSGLITALENWAGEVE